MLKEFKEFAMRGNVIDMAVGIIIGAAFGTIVNSIVADVIMRPSACFWAMLIFQISSFFSRTERRQRGRTSPLRQPRQQAR